eukprot:Filipodium_phascolosomae@DN1516_c0_g1_i1.p1
MQGQERLRILFFHGLEGAPGGTKEVLLRGLYASSPVPPQVHGPDLLTRFRLRSAQVFFCTVLCSSLLCVGLGFWKFPLFEAIFLTCLLIATDCIVFYCCKKWLLGRMLHVALAVANKSLNDFDPHIISASSFGAVVALNLPTKKRPLLLFAPAQYAVCKHLGIETGGLNIEEYPAVSIIHGAKDSLIPIDDSYTLRETCPANCKILSVDDGHRLQKVKQAQVQMCVDYLLASQTNIVV